MLAEGVAANIGVPHEQSAEILWTQLHRWRASVGTTGMPELSDETDTDWPAESDPLARMLVPLIEYIFEAITAGAPERGKAVAVVLEVPARVRAALHRPTIQ
jgi:hypothetical protein